MRTWWIKAKGRSSLFLRTRLVERDEFWRQFSASGAVYFIRNDTENSMKVGYSRDPWKRKTNLQVGSSGGLRLVGVVAAPADVEPVLHGLFRPHRLRGEWYRDAHGEMTAQMNDMSFGEPWLRSAWTLEEGREFFASWDPEARAHTYHFRSRLSPEWDPPLP